MTARIALCLALAASPAFAIDIEGVLPAAMDQPRIYLAISTDAKSPPLKVKGGGGAMADVISEALGEKKPKRDPNDKNADADAPFAIDAFLDTGASGIMLSKTTAEALGIRPITMGNKPVTFYDVGVGGKEPFSVTAPFCLRLGAYSSNTDGAAIEAYSPPSAPTRLKIRNESGMMDELTGGLDVVGMPVMMNRVMVVDARPLAKYEKLKTTLVAPGDKSIPGVDVAVALTHVAYDRFTQIEPANAPRVALAPNPMIGPDPFNKSDPTPPITMSHKGKTTTLSMLLDTGAASSMISSAKAKELGIVVQDGKLTNVAAKDQFMLPIGGIGGTKNVNGFYVDVMQLPAAKGQPIRYLRAPVLVLDITVHDDKAKQTFTLDGVFGMNYLVASANVSTGALGGGVDDMHDGAFEQIVIDHPRKTLGLKLRK